MVGKRLVRLKWAVVVVGKRMVHHDPCRRAPPVADLAVAADLAIAVASAAPVEPSVLLVSALE